MSELVVLMPQPRAVVIFVVLVVTKVNTDVLPPEVMLISMDTGELCVCVSSSTPAPLELALPPLESWLCPLLANTCQGPGELALHLLAHTVMKIQVSHTAPHRRAGPTSLWP